MYTSLFTKNKKEFCCNLLYSKVNVCHKAHQLVSHCCANFWTIRYISQWRQYLAAEKKRKARQNAWRYLSNPCKNTQATGQENTVSCAASKMGPNHTYMYQYQFLLHNIFSPSRLPSWADKYYIPNVDFRKDDYQVFKSTNTSPTKAG